MQVRLLSHGFRLGPQTHTGKRIIQMAYIQTEALVLRKVDFSETSVIVTFLTPQYGRMACLAKGARRKGSPLNASLDTFNRLELTCAWRESRQVQNLIEASVVSAYGVIKRSVPRSAAAAFILDTVLHASWENHPVPELYEATVRGLELLSLENADPCTAAAQTVYALLEAAGVAPGDKDEESLPFTRGKTPAERAEILNALERLGGTETDPGHRETEVLLDFLHDYASHHLEAPLKSYAFLKSVLDFE